MLLTWLRNRRRRRIRAEPFPPEWLPYLENNVAHYRYLTAEEQARLRDDLRIFLAEKNWEGCGGLQMTDEIKVTVSAFACLLVLGMAHNYYDRVRSILVYPHGYRADEVGPDGVVHEGGSGRLGEAHYRGPVILSWDSIRHEGRHPREGHNVVFHEFAHQLDMLDGAVNGTPPLGSRAEYQRWKEVMTREYTRLLDASGHHRATLLDQYGATNEAEFFAVATECFFDRPAEMAHRHPELYALLRDYYRQDPARRLADRHGRAG
ncbi:MAG TPA: M90 family metallopeptidase [Gemmataceae bacterium]|nr:M90 family metallopeptidase [Gemmataceae bacterium]